MKNLVLHDDLNNFKETLSLKEEVFASDIAKLENKSNKRLNPYLMRAINCLIS